MKMSLIQVLLKIILKNPTDVRYLDVKAKDNNNPRVVIVDSLSLKKVGAKVKYSYYRSNK